MELLALVVVDFGLLFVASILLEQVGSPDLENLMFISWNRFWNPETYQIVQELEQQGNVPDTTSQSFSKMLDAEKLKPGPPLTAYYMNQVNRHTGDLGKPQKILGFGFSQSGGQTKWLNRIVSKIKGRRHRDMDKKRQQLALVSDKGKDKDDSSSGTDVTISTSSTDSTSGTDSGEHADAFGRGGGNRYGQWDSSEEMGSEVRLDEVDMESI